MSDDLTLRVTASDGVSNPRTLQGWTDIRVTRGIERCPNDYEIGMTELFPAEAQAITVQPGDLGQVYLGSDLVVTGYVDVFEPSIGPSSHSIRVIGRGKCQDLVDCSVVWPNAQISGNTVFQIAQKLAGFYNITVSEAEGAEIGAVIPQFNLNVTETPYDVIERLCRYRALLAYEDQNGNLVLSAVGSAQAGSGFQEGQNVQQAVMRYSMHERYSEYDTFLQSVAMLDDLGNGGNLLAIAKDNTVLRPRRLNLVAEVAGGGAGLDVAKLRGIWECNRRFGRSFQLRLTTDSWRDANGALWQPNTILPVLELPSLKIGGAASMTGLLGSAAQSWLISEVTYFRNADRGTTADLVIMPKSAFIPQPVLFQPLPVDFEQEFSNIPLGLPGSIIR